MHKQECLTASQMEGSCFMDKRFRNQKFAIVNFWVGVITARLLLCSASSVGKYSHHCTLWAFIFFQMKCRKMQKSRKWKAVMYFYRVMEKNWMFDSAIDHASHSVSWRFYINFMNFTYSQREIENRHSPIGSGRKTNTIFAPKFLILVHMVNGLWILFGEKIHKWIQFRVFLDSLRALTMLRQPFSFFGVFILTT